MTEHYLNNTKHFHSVFSDEINFSRPPPVWFMRQAGRYLPEYKSLRAQAKDFLDFCFTPSLAAEATLQPIRRFNFDAAILFADILLVPYALGQSVRFEENIGPVLESLSGNPTLLSRLSPDNVMGCLDCVYETVSRVKSELPSDVALIGFAGAPWTVATYMIGGRSTKDRAPALAYASRKPQELTFLLDMLVEATVPYLEGQIKAGAEVIQLFDTWAGDLSEFDFESYVIKPTAEIVRRLRSKYPHVDIIGFPRGVGNLYVDYVKRTGVSGISIDASVEPSWAAQHLCPLGVVQGNIDPEVVVLGGEVMEASVARLRETLYGLRFIAGLGHGILPHTPPEHVAELVDEIRRMP
ncbi:MAG: uroporphyrinogen decarboxylase [Parvularculales bacterium]